jgi:hypothetical protein
MRHWPHSSATFLFFLGFYRITSAVVVAVVVVVAAEEDELDVDDDEGVVGESR